MSDWFKNLFIDEAKCALNKGGAVSDEQISSAVNAYLDENPVSSATSVIENNVLKVK